MNSPFPEYSLSELVEFQPSVKLLKGDKYPFIPMENITPGVRDVLSQEIKTWSGSGTKFQNNDVLFARITPCLENRKIAVANIDGIGFGSTEYFILRGKLNKINQTFLYYLAITDLLVESAINSYVGASGRQRADAKFLKRIKINIPSLPTQKKITAILSAYDDLIENNKRRIALLEKMAEEIYREWFVRFRFPDYQSSEFEKGIPKGWEPSTFSSVCSFLKGKNPSEVVGNKEEGFEYYVNVDTLNGNLNSFAKIQKNSVICELGDILMLMDGSRSGLTFRANVKGIVGSTLSIIKVDKNLKNFVFEYLKAMHQEIIFNNTGSAIPHANKDYIKRMILYIPNDESLFASFNGLYNAKYKMIENLRNQNIKLIQTKNMLLPRLISGKLSVEDLDIQFPPSMMDEAEEVVSG